MNQKLKILLLCDYNLSNASMVIDHINSLYYYSEHDVYILSDIVQNSGNLPKIFFKSTDNKSEVNLEVFDVVVIHYSMILSMDSYISSKLRCKLKDYKGLKVIFLQDEYRFVNKTIEVIREVEVKILFTCVPDSEIEKIYPKSLLGDVKVVNVLTGYVSELAQLFPIKPWSARKFDISYRGRKYPLWHGRLGFEKWAIARVFIANAEKYNWKVNISTNEKDRLYGYDWIQLLSDSKATLGVESGASVFDFDGTVSSLVETKCALSLISAPSNYVEEVAEFEKFRSKFLSNIEDKYNLAQISSRIFEAITLRTLLILYEGDYSGVIKPWIHYIPVKKDHSNLQEISDVLKDDDKCTDIIARAYADIVATGKYSYKSFVKKFDNVINANINSDFIKEDGLIALQEYYLINKLIIVTNPYGIQHRVSFKFLKIIKNLIKSSIRFLKNLTNRLTEV